MRPLGLAAALALASTAPAAATVVSLTFDDGRVSQRTAIRLLDERGLKGTFYVNSVRIGRGSNLSLADLQGLAAKGHEVGGHTLDHVDLSTVAAEERVRQICDDRGRIAAWGFSPTSFAYPFGSYDAEVMTAVADCGYGSARTTSGIGCGTCGRAETIPPARPYALRAPGSIQGTQGLAELQKLVTDAEAAGGWLLLTFHDVMTGTSEKYNTEPQTLAAFLDWLKARRSRGTYVQPVGAVMNGDAPPAETPPPPPPPPPPGEAGLSDAFEFRDLYVFPNPARGGRATVRVQLGRADGVDLYVYDVSGRLLHSASLGPPVVVDDGNGKGPQVTYDYAWDGSGLGSGVYLLLVKARRTGYGVIGRLERVAVVQ